MAVAFCAVASLEFLDGAVFEFFDFVHEGATDDFDRVCWSFDSPGAFCNERVDFFAFSRLPIVTVWRCSGLAVS